MCIYLDYNASTPIDSRVIDSMVNSYKNFYGNADSRTHYFGEHARLEIEDARNKISKLLNIKSTEIIFTSGATEANNLAILGLRKYGLKNNKKHIITSSIEHKAILQSMKSLEEFGFEIDFVNPDENGVVSISKIISLLKPNTLLVSLMHCNNETGVIQPVKELGDFLQNKDVFFHIDATQSCGKLVEEIQNLNYDMMSISAHKMYGPQGIGALILKKKRYQYPPIESIMFGGNQEHGFRPGTLPTALIVGFGKAAEIALQDYKKINKHNFKIKNEIIKLLDESGIKYCVNGNINQSINNTINVSFIGVQSEALMISVRQCCSISNGSACNSSSYDLSHVLKSMNLSQERIESAVRISWGKEIDMDDFKVEFKRLLNIVKELTL